MIGHSLTMFVTLKTPLLHGLECIHVVKALVVVDMGTK